LPLEVRAILDGIGEQGAAALAAAGLELRMAPAACEVPVPRCFREDRQQVGFHIVSWGFWAGKLYRSGPL